MAPSLKTPRSFSASSASLGRAKSFGPPSNVEPAMSPKIPPYLASNPSLYWSPATRITGCSRRTGDPRPTDAAAGRPGQDNEGDGT